MSLLIVLTLTSSIPSIIPTPSNKISTQKTSYFYCLHSVPNTTKNSHFYITTGAFRIFPPLPESALGIIISYSQFKDSSLAIKYTKDVVSNNSFAGKEEITLSSNPFHEEEVFTFAIVNGAIFIQSESKVKDEDEYQFSIKVNKNLDVLRMTNCSIDSNQKESCGKCFIGLDATDFVKKVLRTVKEKDETQLDTFLQGDVVLITAFEEIIQDIAKENKSEEAVFQEFSKVIKDIKNNVLNKNKESKNRGDKIRNILDTLKMYNYRAYGHNLLGVRNWFVYAIIFIMAIILVFLLKFLFDL